MREYYYSDGKERFGPLSFDSLKDKGISKTTLVWHDGLPDWQPAKEVNELSSWFEADPIESVVSETKTSGQEKKPYTPFVAINPMSPTLQTESTIKGNSPTAEEIIKSESEQEDIANDHGTIYAPESEFGPFEYDEDEDNDKEVDNSVNNVQTGSFVEKRKMFSDLGSFDGRIRRTEYGLTALLFVVLHSVALILLFTLGQGLDQDSAWQALAKYGSLYLVMWYLLIGQSTKRCHDLCHNGWWQLIPFYFFWLLFQDGQPGANEYGENPKGKSS
jgi:uncharacterized membrane protein YhaH (DUF805 family)